MRFQRDRIGKKFNISGRVTRIDVDHVEVDAEWTGAWMKGLTTDQVASLNRGDRISAICKVAEREEHRVRGFLLDSRLILSDCALTP